MVCVKHFSFVWWEAFCNNPITSQLCLAYYLSETCWNAYNSIVMHAFERRQTTTNFLPFIFRIVSVSKAWSRIFSVWHSTVAQEKMKNFTFTVHLIVFPTAVWITLLVQTGGGWPWFRLGSPLLVRLGWSQPLCTVQSNPRRQRPVERTSLYCLTSSSVYWENLLHLSCFPHHSIVSIPDLWLSRVLLIVTYYILRTLCMCRQKWV